MTDNRNSAISLCRVCSMLMIVLCHIVSYFTFLPMHDDLPNILNVGVFSFLLISGYLYGGRTIGDFKGWMLQRLRKIAFPSLILCCTVMAVSGLCGRMPNGITILFYLFQLQEFMFVVPIPNVGFAEYSILGPLWFITVILMCYCLVPFLQWLRKHLNTVHSICGTMLLCIVCFLCSAAANVCLFYFLTFSIGYLIGAECIPKRDRRISFALCTVVMVAFQILRLYFRWSWDGTPFYQTFTYVSHMVLGIWLVDFFFFLERMVPEWTKAVSQSPLAVFFEKYALYIYITHGIFSLGPVSPYSLFRNPFPATVLFCLLTMLSAHLLMRVNSWLGDHMFLSSRKENQ